MILPKRFAPSFDAMTFSRQTIEASAIVLNGADGLNIANDTQIAGGGAVVTQPIYVAGFNFFQLMLQAGDVSASLVLLDPQDNFTELYEVAMGSSSANGGIDRLSKEIHGMHTIKLKISNNSAVFVASIGTVWSLILSKI